MSDDEETNDNYSMEQSEQFLVMARTRMIPVLHDAATWTLHEQGRHFTHDERTPIEAAILIGTICQFLKSTTDSTPDACACDGCSAKRFDRNARTFLLALTRTMIPQAFEQAEEQS